MDPDATLDRIRKLVVKHDTYDFSLDGDEVNDLVYLIDSLDAWLHTGGFLPSVWEADHAVSVRTAERAAIVQEIRAMAEDVRRKSYTQVAGIALGAMIDDVADRVNILKGNS